MDNLIATLTNSQFLIALLAAVAAAAVVFSIGATFFSGGSKIRQRIKRVALEREKMRAMEMARLRGGSGSNDQGTRTIRQAAGKDYMKNVVERFSLEKAFMDDNTVDKLSRAGYRGPSAVTTWLFLRFVTPIVLALLVFLYLAFVYYPDKPLWLNAVYGIFAGLVGSFLPAVLLKNQTGKRQQSIRRSWPDALDLVLLCVESGMSVEHALKRVAKEIGNQSVELAEEITLTTAELSFLEDRTKAYENLGNRTGLDNVKGVMQALIQAERHGTSVGTALRVMADEGREARMMEAEKKAAALPPKLTVPLIVFFLPVLFIVILSPAVIRVFATPFFGGGGG
ncbi:MAG: type II secretion system F family protein [Devosia sp.]